MECPKCSANNEETAEYCFSCGTQLIQPQVNLENREIKKKETFKPVTMFKNIKHKKIICAAALVIVAVILTLLIVSVFSQENGMKIAYNMRQNLGQNIVTVERSAKVHVNTFSAFSAINKPADFDYIYESEKGIVVDGVNVPEWTITLYAVDTEITKIYYRDYTQQNKNYKGTKFKQPVEYSDLQDAKTLSEIEKKFNISPVSITFYIDKTADYRFMYYFVNENGDEERREFIVTVDEESNVASIQETDFDELFNNIE